MMHSVNCSWCHTPTRIASGYPTTCDHCGHRADLPRLQCDCRTCLPDGSPIPAHGVHPPDDHSLAHLKPQ